MRGMPIVRLFPFSHRTRLVVWATTTVLIVFGPIAQAAWDLRSARRQGGLGYPEVRMTDASAPPPSPEVAEAAEWVARYRARRNPVVERLLPEGIGGTRFFQRLDGYAGMAFSDVAAIGLATTVESDLWPETVELHERAHLLHAFLPQEVARLMARMPAAAPGEYAATNPGEHFAEMAAKAWEVVAPPGDFCIDGTPADWLSAAEIRVPGTAGFAAWYLRQPALRSGEGCEELPPLAARLSEPQRAEWEALWQALEARRLPGGTFRPWSYPTVRDYLEARRWEARSSGRWIGRVENVLLAPSLAVLTLAGR